jgi:predicted dehydrogenase
MVRIHRWETTATVRREPLGLPGPLVRDLEQVLWLTGRRAERVFALAQPAAKANSSTGRFVQVHLGFDHGMALIDYDSRLPEGAGYQSLSVIGTLGAAYADDQRNAQLVFQGGPPQGLVAGEGCVPVANMVQSLVDHLHGTAQPAARPTTWFDALELVGAVKRSLESGQAVSLEKQ